MYSTFIFLAYWIVYSAAQQSIVDKLQYNVGDTFDITCNAAKFIGQPPTTATYLYSLTLMRKTAANDYTLIAYYKPFVAPEERNYSNPLFSHWAFQFLNGESYENRPSMNLIVTVHSLQCTDSGLYKCTTQVAEKVYETVPVNITARAIDSTSKPEFPKGSAGSNVGSIVAGGILFLVIIGVLIYFFVIQKKKQQDEVSEDFSQKKVVATDVW
ncbi:hypothetical protein BgiBS90_023895 [Biomphalaria glabrata]|nr:hypothetical protein BgiBS90_023895 [Biomphalaria glabrata]